MKNVIIFTSVKPNRRLTPCFVAGSFAFSTFPTLAQTAGPDFAKPQKSFIYYFSPTPIVGSLTTNVWVAPKA